MRQIVQVALCLYHINGTVDPLNLCILFTGKYLMLFIINWTKQFWKF